MVLKDLFSIEVQLQKEMRTVKKSKLLIILLASILLMGLSTIPSGAYEIIPIDPGLLLPPAAPTNLDADNVTATSVTLTWEDNSAYETGFELWRVKVLDGVLTFWGKVADIDANTTEYTDTGLSSSTTYRYKIRAVNGFGNSDFSNIVEATTLTLVYPLPIDPSTFWPAAPSGLSADSVSADEVKLSWDDNSGNESGFKLERAVGGGSFSLIATLGVGIEEYTDSSVDPDTTYSYKVKAYNTFGSSAYSNTLSVSTLDADEEEEEEEIDDPLVDNVSLKFVIGSKSYNWNGSNQTMDVAPIIRQSRTLLPIRYVADPLGAQVLWNANEGKVTIKQGSKTIELWINNNTAKVNGTSVKIDAYNSNVTPVIIPPGRTMLPLRFIADNLDCNVLWNPADQSILVTYPE